MWSKLEDKTLPLQNQGHANCTTNKECTGFSCQGIYQGKDINFGVRVLPCKSTPGVEIFGYAPQYNAQNFSHVFTHRDTYEVPGALLNVSMLPSDGVKPGAESLIKGMLEVHLKMNHQTDTLTFGLTAKACINATCIFSKPLFNNTEIPVPDCPNDIPSDPGFDHRHHGVEVKPVKVSSVCSMSDIEACGLNQVCRQQQIGSKTGICSCLPGFSINEADRTCISIKEEEKKLHSEQINRPKKSTASLPVSSSADNSRSSILQRRSDTNGGAIAAVVVSLLAVLVVIGVGIGIVMRTRIGTRLRAHMTNTPYGDVAAAAGSTSAPGGGGATQMGSTTTLQSNMTSRQNFA